MRSVLQWRRVVFFGGVANIMEQYLRKGSKVYIEGKLQTRKWQDKSGQDRYTTEVVVDGFNGVMQMLDNRGGVGDTRGFDTTPASPSFNQPATDSGAFEYRPF